MKYARIRLLAFLLSCTLIGTAVSVPNTAFAEEILSGFTANQNLTYQNSVTFSEGELKLSGYEITISGDMHLTGGTISLGGGVLTVDGSYRIESEQSGENSSGCLDINQADTGIQSNSECCTDCRQRGST